MQKKAIVTGAGHFHAVRFYRDAIGLSSIVGDFLGEGLALAQPAIVIATPVHRLAIESQLTKRKFDVAKLTRDGALLMLDAEATLATFMVDGVADAERFRNAIIPAIQTVSAGRPQVVVRAYGEMVDVLWKSGKVVAATRVETLWNALANTHAFALLCGYAMGNFYKDAAVERICSHHTHVLSEDGEVAVVC